MFVTLKVFKLIGPSNDGRRHGRGTYLFLSFLHLLSIHSYHILTLTQLARDAITNTAYGVSSLRRKEGRKEGRSTA
jgi:hypothetical protein